MFCPMIKNIIWSFRKIALILTLVFLFPAAWSSELPAAVNSVYVQILGKAGYGSINYERQLLLRGNTRFGLHGGLGTYNVYDFTGSFNPDLIIPVSVNALYGSPHSIEIGAGQTISSIVQANPAGWQPERVNRLSAVFVFGYRFQRPEGGFIFRIGYNPVFEFYRRFVHWGGLSFGYAF